MSNLRERHAPRIRASLGDPLGPWTHQHSIGAAVVVLILLALAASIWPGWPVIRGLFG